MKNSQPATIDQSDINKILGNIDQEQLKAQELTELRARLQRETREMQTLSKEFEDSQRELDDFKRDPFRKGSGPVTVSNSGSPRERELVDLIKSAATALEEAKNKVNRTQVELTDFEKELNIDLHEVSEKHLNAFMQTFEQAKEDINKIHNAIEKQKALIAKASPEKRDMSSLNTQREQCLADIALGNASEEDLLKIDEEISQQKETIRKEAEEAIKVINPAQATIAGLKQKLTAAEEHLTRLKTEGRALLIAFFESEAEKEGKQYIRDAVKLSRSFKRMVAINGLIERYSVDGSQKSILFDTWDEILLPGFRLGSFTNNNFRGNAREIIFSLPDHFNADEMDAEEEIELNKVQEIIGLIN